MREKPLKRTGLSWSRLLAATGVAVIFSWLFFRDLRAVCITFPVGVVFYLEQGKKSVLQSVQERRSQCKDALLAVSSALLAGYALENALSQAKEALCQIWGEDSLIVQEWTRMEAGLRLHIPVEQVFADFAARMELPEMEQLAGLLAVAKRSGGRLSLLMKTAASQMEERMHVEGEIRTRLTEKRMELYIMLLMPPGILLYLQSCSYEIISALYETLWGHVFMMVCLAVYGLGWWIGMRILDIRM